MLHKLRLTMGQATGFGTGLSTNVLGYAVAQRLRFVFFAGKRQNVVMLQPIFFPNYLWYTKTTFEHVEHRFRKKTFHVSTCRENQKHIAILHKKLPFNHNSFLKNLYLLFENNSFSRNSKKSLFEIIPSSCLVRHFLENPRFLYSWLHSYKPLKPEIYTNRFWGQKNFLTCFLSLDCFFKVFPKMAAGATIVPNRTGYQFLLWNRFCKKKIQHKFWPFQQNEKANAHFQFLFNSPGLFKPASLWQKLCHFYVFFSFVWRVFTYHKW